jgi:hypothetical protein
MTPKEKAEELYNKFCEFTPVEFEQEYTKKCALIAVDEIISSSPSLPILGDGGTYGEDIELSTKYWQEVKQEIEKL